jgi:hypothetical protein
MATYDSFYNLVMLWVPNCPQPLILREIKKAVRAFCDSSRIYTAEITVPIVADTTEYELEAPEGTEIIGIDTVKKDDYPFTGAYRYEPTTLTLKYTPTEACELTVTVSVKPTENATNIPNILVTHFEEGIVARALASLLALPNTSWQNIDLAAFQTGVYTKEVRKARIKKFSQYGAKTLRLQIPKFI